MISDVRDAFKDMISPLVEDSEIVLSLEGEQTKPDGAATRIRLKVFPQETVNIAGRSAIGQNRWKEEPGRVAIDIIGPQMDGRANVEDLSDAVVTALETKSYSTPAGNLVVWSAWRQEVQEDAPYYRVVVYARYALFH